MRKFFVISKDDCPWCDKVFDLLDDRRHKYESFTIYPDDDGLRFFLKEVLGHKTVPQVYEYQVNQGERGWFHIGGYEDLKRHLGHEG
jgi:glutaredoxin